MGLIWWLSDRPSGDFAELPFPHADKLVHFVLFGVLSGLWMRGLGRLSTAIMIAVVWGALDEWHQGWVVGRSPDLADWLFDVLGAAAGALISRPRSPRRSD